MWQPGSPSASDHGKQPYTGMSTRILVQDYHIKMKNFGTVIAVLAIIGERKMVYLSGFASFVGLVASTFNDQEDKLRKRLDFIPSCKRVLK